MKLIRKCLVTKPIYEYNKGDIVLITETESGFSYKIFSGNYGTEKIIKCGGRFFFDYFHPIKLHYVRNKKELKEFVSNKDNYSVEDKPIYYQDDILNNLQSLVDKYIENKEKEAKERIDHCYSNGFCIASDKKDYKYEDIKKYYHPKFEVVAKLIRLLYDLEGCSCGGCCHIVTDDNNIRNSDLEFVIKYCKENEDEIDSEISSTICEIMLQMTIEQRIMLFYTLEKEDFYFCNFTKEEYIDYFNSIKASPEDIIKKCIANEDYNI